jgi:phosphatidate cytidylyltransferase
MYVLPLCQNQSFAMATIATLLIVVFLAALFRFSFRRRRVEGAVSAAAATLFALVYLGLMPGFYVSLRLTHSAWVIAGIIVITKFGDCGAYFTGRLIGRHKLIPWLSPNKTWEGLIGAMVSAMLTAVLVAWGLNEFEPAASWRVVRDVSTPYGDCVRYPLVAAAFAGVVLGVVGHVGDLVASLLKRDAGVKDFGNTVPGFGGLIDLFDSPILVAPAAYWMLHLAALAG